MGLRDRLHPDEGEWALQRCRACASDYIDPRPTMEAVGRLYSGEYYTHEPPTPPDEWPKARGAALRQRLLLGYINKRFGYAMAPASRLGGRLVPALPGVPGMASNHVRHLPHRPGARVLDVGCGNGTFLVRMRAGGWAVAGVEPDRIAASFARAAGLEVKDGLLTEGLFPPGHFDAITMNHVIEHLHEPQEVLAICWRLLRPGGTIWIATPNAAAAGHRRFGRSWLPLDPPRHLVLFTLRSLEAALTRAGFATLRPPVTLLAMRWTYRMSLAYGRGRDPFASAPMSAGLALRALGADLRTLVDPGNGEEITVVGQKPTS
jgi:2-polyprenyl-3-methyl-5-hydroxy-6-metoxy-1,4-benzoquinol methylase